ncbi:unnamed protein product [Spirodela intermedia]|uniref:Uncharacterized protein n=1 Tax=Spirodela intermedia TaxID=51605 RepID=A0A7I8JZL4_SPIIN|nr:unnamed protein product [Spirodela intermedia]
MIMKTYQAQSKDRLEVDKIKIEIIKDLPLPINLKQLRDGNEYILMGVDYVFRWVESIATRTCDSKIEKCYPKVDIKPCILRHYGLIE